MLGQLASGRMFGEFASSSSPPSLSSSMDALRVGPDADGAAYSFSLIEQHWPHVRAQSEQVRPSAPTDFAMFA